MSPDKRHALEEACPDRPLFDRRNLAPRKMKEGIDRRLGEYFRQNLKDFFPAAAASQPIVDQGDPDVIHRVDYSPFPAARSR